MNAPYLLHEIAAALDHLAQHREPRTLFLSQFPMTEEDARTLQATLGDGQVTIHCRGEHPALWRETAIAGVWWGEYREGERVALRTIEIAEFPELAASPREEIATSARTIRETVSTCTKPA